MNEKVKKEVIEKLDFIYQAVLGNEEKVKNPVTKAEIRAVFDDGARMLKEQIGVQHGAEVDAARPLPNNRIHQWLDRLNPYIRWDSDRFSFHDGDLEHIRLAATPGSRDDDRDLALAMVGQEDIKWVPTGDINRMDAVWIVHGLPVTLLERLDEFRAQYENQYDFPVTEEFHLNPHWVNLPEITPETPPTYYDPNQAPDDGYQGWGVANQR